MYFYTLILHLKCNRPGFTFTQQHNLWASWFDKFCQLVFFSKQTLLFSTLVNLYQFYYLFPLRNRTTDVATQLMWKREKGSSRKLKKNLEKTCGHIVSTDHHLSYIYTFTQHSWAYFQNQSFQSLQILCPACFLILMTTTKLSEIGASILNNFYLCHEANFWIYC